MTSEQRAGDLPDDDAWGEQFRRRLRKKPPQGEPPSIEDELTRAPEERRDRLFRVLLLWELVVRAESEEGLPQTAETDYLLRFNDRTAAVAAVFASRRPLGRFRFIELVKMGGRGEVYKAKDAEFDRVVALKQLQQWGIRDQSYLVSFEREAELTGNLEHPNIVPVYSRNRFADGLPFYAMRYLGHDFLVLIEKFRGAVGDPRVPSPRKKSAALDEKPAPADDARWTLKSLKDPARLKSLTQATRSVLSSSRERVRSTVLKIVNAVNPRRSDGQRKFRPLVDALRWFREAERFARDQAIILRTQSLAQATRSVLSGSRERVRSTVLKIVNAVNPQRPDGRREFRPLVVASRRFREAARFAHDQTISLRNQTLAQATRSVLSGSRDRVRSAVLKMVNAVKPRRPDWRREFRPLVDALRRICEASQFAHEQKIIHRDIKPENILVGQHPDEVQLIDWGLAARLGEEPQAIVGTPEYMSPEQAAARRDSVRPASDVFSIGATLYHALTGKAPKLTGRSLPLSPRDADPRVPVQLDAICRKATQSLPEDRYASALELAKDLTSWVNRDAVTACPESLATRTLRFAVRHAWAASALLVTCVVFGLLIGFLSLRVYEITYDLVNVHKVVDPLLTDLADDIQDLANHQRLRHDLIAGMQNYYEQLPSRESDDSHVRLERAQKDILLGKLLKDDGKFVMAEQRLKEAKKFYTERWTPDREIYLAEISNQLGHIYREKYQREKAEPHYIFTSEILPSPGDRTTPRLQRVSELWAQNYFLRADLLHSVAADFNTANYFYMKAIKEHEDRVPLILKSSLSAQFNPNHEQLSKVLSWSGAGSDLESSAKRSARVWCREMGRMLGYLGDLKCDDSYPNVADDPYWKSIQYRLALCECQPNSPRNLLHLAQSFNNFGRRSSLIARMTTSGANQKTWALRRSWLENSHGWHERAQLILDKLVKQNNEVDDYEAERAWTKYYLAVTEIGLDRVGGLKARAGGKKALLVESSSIFKRLALPDKPLDYERGLAWSTLRLAEIEFSDSKPLAPLSKAARNFYEQLHDKMKASLKFFDKGPDSRLRADDQAERARTHALLAKYEVPDSIGENLHLGLAIQALKAAEKYPCLEELYGEMQAIARLRDRLENTSITKSPSVRGSSQIHPDRDPSAFDDVLERLDIRIDSDAAANRAGLSED